MRTAVEEVKSLRYMLWCLGVALSGPLVMLGDNLSVIQNSSLPTAALKKKHVALSYHIVQEAVAAGVVSPMWLKSEHNHADILTKQIGRTPFMNHVHDCFWTPPTRREGSLQTQMRNRHSGKSSADNFQS